MIPQKREVLKFNPGMKDTLVSTGHERAIGIKEHSEVSNWQGHFSYEGILSEWLRTSRRQRIEPTLSLIIC